MTYDAVPLIPRSVLFGNPTYAMPTISPDGRWLAFLAPEEGVLNVWVGPVDAPDQAKAVTHDRGQGIRVYGFTHDDKHLYYLQDADGDENWRLHLLDLESGEERCPTPFDGVQVRVLGHNRWNPTVMILGINKDTPELHDLYRLDLETDELEKVVENTPGFVTWLLDTNLDVRGGASMNEDGGITYYRISPQTNEPEAWLEVPSDDAVTTDTIGFSRDGSTLFLVSSIGANAARLVAIDLSSATETVLAQDPAYDIDGVELDPMTRVPQGVVFAKDRAERIFLDPSYSAAMAQVEAAIGIDGDLTVNRTERTDRLWLISVDVSDGSGRYYVFDKVTGQATFLFGQRPELDGYQLAVMEPFAFNARDGLEVHGYVTYPPNVEPSALPAVVNVHGGPWHRDEWGYHSEAQWLANRGYACVQVNFRGSTGYGKAFGNAGDKEWGAAMHTDLLDAVDHLASMGRIDASRVAIYGGSYGGYAALAGAAFTPGVFRCAVDMCGPSNLLTLLASLPTYWKPMIAMMYGKIGDPESEKDFLWERSPLSRVDDIAIPVLVAQGANDPRVKQAEAEQIVDALKAKGLPHEYLLFPDEGHGLARPENREIYYAAVERFLAEHLGGGRSQTDA